MTLNPRFLVVAFDLASNRIHRDGKLANRVLVQVSELLRRGLTAVGGSDIPLQEEVDFVRSYLELERIAYAGALLVEWSLIPPVLNAFLPPLVLQSLVEDAMGSDLSRARRPARIEIGAHRAGALLSLQVRAGHVERAGGNANREAEGPSQVTGGRVIALSFPWRVAPGGGDSLAGRESYSSRAGIQSLKEELDPHFLFSSLNAVSALIEEEPHRAQRLLASLREVMSAATHETKSRQTSLAREIRLAEPALELEVARYANSLRVEWDVGDDALPGQVPRMIVHSLFVQTLQHAIAGSTQLSRVTISARRQSGRLTLRLRGGGVPTQRFRPQHLCDLRPLHARVQRLHGGSYHLEVSLLAAGDVLTILDLPWRTADADVIASLPAPNPREMLP